MLLWDVLRLDSHELKQIPVSQVLVEQRKLRKQENLLNDESCTRYMYKTAVPGRGLFSHSGLREQSCWDEGIHSSVKDKICITTKQSCSRLLKSRHL